MYPQPGKERIVSALVEILQDRNLESVTVKELVSKAHVNRSCYYYHFKGLDSVIEYLMEMFLVSFRESFSCFHDASVHGVMDDSLEGVKEHFRFFSQNRQAYLAILNSGRGPELNKLLLEEQVKEFSQYEKIHTSSSGERVSLSPLAEEYRTLAVGAVMVAFLENWARHGFDLTPEELSSLLIRVLDLQTSRGTMQFVGQK